MEQNAQLGGNVGPLRLRGGGSDKKKKGGQKWTGKQAAVKGAQVKPVKKPPHKSAAERLSALEKSEAQNKTLRTLVASGSVMFQGPVGASEKARRNTFLEKLLGCEVTAVELGRVMYHPEGTRYHMFSVGTHEDGVMLEESKAVLEKLKTIPAETLTPYRLIVPEIPLAPVAVKPSVDDPIKVIVNGTNPLTTPDMVVKTLGETMNLRVKVAKRTPLVYHGITMDGGDWEVELYPNDVNLDGMDEGEQAPSAIGPLADSVTMGGYTYKVGHKEYQCKESLGVYIQKAKDRKAAKEAQREMRKAEAAAAARVQNEAEEEAVRQQNAEADLLAAAARDRAADSDLESVEDEMEERVPKKQKKRQASQNSD